MEFIGIAVAGFCCNQPIWYGLTPEYAGIKLSEKVFSVCWDKNWFNGICPTWLNNDDEPKRITIDNIIFFNVQYFKKTKGNWGIR